MVIGPAITSLEQTDHYRRATLAPSPEPFARSPRWTFTPAPTGKSSCRGTGRSNCRCTQDLAARFADGAPIDDLIPQGGQLNTRGFHRALQGWIAEEVRRVARKRGVAQGDLVDVTPKTLRLWVKGG